MKRIVWRLISIIPALILQFLWYLFILNFYNEHKIILEAVLTIATFFIILYIISKKGESTYKILWLILIYTLPIFGTWLYICYGDYKTSNILANSTSKSKKKIKFNHETNVDIIKELDDKTCSYDEIIENVSKYSGFPINYINNVKYYSLGEDMYNDMIEELKKAKKFIYIEYFIIANGVMWKSITDILKDKATQGIDIRIMYDDIGSISTYSKKDFKKLTKFGIKVTTFNPVRKIDGQLNNRNHRKMMIIDNNIVFSGGVNLADEYVNITHRFGHWKDIGFKLDCDGVSNYTYMFTEFWNAFSKDKITQKIDQQIIKNDKGYVLSYYDSPNNKDAISNDLYIELLENAKEYMYFYTPYLILGDDLLKALIRTGRRGIDVKIILPGIPDKKVVYRIAKSYYNELIQAGIKIYTYTPGFVHAKATLSDDLICTIGTVNLDYRSLFLNYENNSIFYKSEIINDLKKDYLETLKKCKKVKLIKKNVFNYLVDGILRLVAPLL